MNQNQPVKRFLNVSGYDTKYERVLYIRAFSYDTGKNAFFVDGNGSFKVFNPDTGEEDYLDNDTVIRFGTLKKKFTIKLSKTKNGKPILNIIEVTKK